MPVEMRVKPGQNPVTSLVVIAESQSPEELTSADTRNRVITFARVNGLPMASGIGSLPNYYPVDEDGKCDEDLILGKRTHAKFQVEYTVNAAIR